MPRNILWQGGTLAFAGLDVACKQDEKGIYVCLPGFELDLSMLKDEYTSHAINFVFEGQSYMAYLKLEHDRKLSWMQFAHRRVAVVMQKLPYESRSAVMAVLVGMVDTSAYTLYGSWLANIVICREELAPQEQITASDTGGLTKIYTRC